MTYVFLLRDKFVLQFVGSAYVQSVPAAVRLDEVNDYWQICTAIFNLLLLTYQILRIYGKILM